MSEARSGNALVRGLLLVSAAIGLGAMSLGAWGVWISAHRFPADSTSLLVAQGFGILAVLAVFGGFCSTMFTLLRPLFGGKPDPSGKLNGLLVVMAPAVTGLVSGVYLGIAVVVLRAAYWALID